MKKRAWIYGVLGMSALVTLAVIGAWIPAENAEAQQNPPMGYSYAVKFVCGQETDDAPWATQGIYRTEINIFNQAPDRDVLLEKSAIILVEKGEAIGREPEQQGASGFDSIQLGPLNATMDDCERIAEITGRGWPINGLMIGFLDIVSPVEITVDAVYTSRHDAGGHSIEVERVEGKERCP